MENYYERHQCLSVIGKKLDGPTLMHQLEAEAEKYKYDWAAIMKAHGEED